MGLPPGGEYVIVAGLVLVIGAYRVGKRVGRSEAQAQELADLKAKAQRTSAA